MIWDKERRAHAAKELLKSANANEPKKHKFLRGIIYTSDKKGLHAEWTGEFGIYYFDYLVTKRMMVNSKKDKR